MAEINVENIEDLNALFEEKMGFPADAEGLEMTEEQLVNFMLLCHQAEYGMMDDDSEEEYEEMDDDGMKVKVIKLPWWRCWFYDGRTTRTQFFENDGKVDCPSSK